jgi:hypothetical protein
MAPSPISRYETATVLWQLVADQSSGEAES